VGSDAAHRITESCHPSVTVETFAMTQRDTVESARFLAIAMRKRLWRQFFGYALAQAVLMTLLAYFLIFVFVSSPQGFFSLLVLCVGTLAIAMRWAWIYADLRTVVELTLRGLGGKP